MFYVTFQFCAQVIFITLDGNRLCFVRNVVAELTKMLIQKHVLVGKIASTIPWLQREMELPIHAKSSPPSGCLCHDLTAFLQNDPFVTRAAWGLWMDYRRNVQHRDYRADKLELVSVPTCLDSPHPPPLLSAQVFGGNRMSKGGLCTILFSWPEMIASSVPTDCVITNL